jgi:hypothetical protein
MEPATTAQTPVITSPAYSLNVQDILNQAIHGQSVTVGIPSFFDLQSYIPLITTIWIGITVLAYVASLGFLAILMHSRIRMRQVEAVEDLKYTTISDAPHALEEIEHHRWTHVRELIEGTSPNDWRQAIIEADIILDDMLTRLGYQGAGVGEKLKTVDPAKFNTLQEAWEAHKVRNDIAHQGSEYQLTDHLAYRTILHYENVFKEHHEI